MDEKEESEIVMQLIHEGEQVTAGKVQAIVRKFVKARRRDWIEENNEEALRSEKRFKADDGPCLPWCEKFLARHASSISFEKVQNC